MSVARLGPKPKTISHVSPADAVNVKESTSPVVERTQLVPQYVSPETMGTFCAGSVGQFLVAVAAHTELGARTVARSRAASGGRMLLNDRMMFLLDWDFSLGTEAGGPASGVHFTLEGSTFWRRTPA